MKKKINNKDIPGYAYGASEVVGAVTNGLAATMPYATSGKATVGTALGGMTSGAAAGAALGPWGAVAGAAIGGIMGSIGSGGSVDEMTGEITMPSGIAGLFGHSRGYLRRKSNLIKNSNLSRQMTDAIRADYYNNSMAEYNPNTFAQGGTVGEQATIKMSKGEIAQDKVTKETYSPEPNAAPNGKDDVIVNAHVGDSIMSNKRKDIDKEMTNAQWAKKFIKPNKKATDKYAQGTLDAQNLLWQIGINKQEEAKTKKVVGEYNVGTGFVEGILNRNKKEFNLPKFESKEIPPIKTKSTAWSKLADSLPQLAQLASPIMNMVKGREKVQPVQARTVTPTYARTTVDNRPLLRQIRNEGAIARYNANNLGSVAPAFLSQLAVNQMKSLADVDSDTYNKEITLAHQNANISNRVKEYNAAAQHTADVEYAQNLAARDNIWSTGVSQLGQMIGGINRDNKLMARDAALYRYMLPMLDFGTESKYYDLLNKYYGVA